MYIYVSPTHGDNKGYYKRSEGYYQRVVGAYDPIAEDLVVQQEN